MATFNYKQLVEQVKREATDVIKGGLGEIDFNNIFRDTIKKLNINLDDFVEFSPEQLTNILSKSIASAFNDVDIKKLSKRNPLSGILSEFEEMPTNKLEKELQKIIALRERLEERRFNGENITSEINELNKKFVVLNTYLSEVGIKVKDIDGEFQDLLEQKDFSDVIQMTKEYVKQLQTFDDAIINFRDRSEKDFSDALEDQISNMRNSLAKGEVALKDALKEISSKINFKSNVSENLSPIETTQLQLANEELNKEIELLKERNKVLIEARDPYKQLLNMFGDKGKQFLLDNIPENISDLDTELKQVLIDTKLINNETQKLKVISEGNTNKGGIIGEDSVAIFRNVKNIDNSLSLKEKLDAAYSSGVNVSRILNVVQKQGSSTFLEIQEKAKGTIIGEDYKFLNFDFLEATDEELDKLYEDVKKLSALDLGLDMTLSNIFYEKGKGFNFIDISHGAESMEDFAQDFEYTMNIIKETIEEKGYDKTYINKVDDFFSRYKSVVEKNTSRLVDVAADSTAKAQKSHSPSKLAEILGEYWGEGYAKGILEHTDEVKDAVTKLITEGLKVGDKVTKMSVEELKEDIAANISGSDDYENLAIELMWMDLDSLAKPQKQMEYNDSVSLEYARSLEKDIDELTRERDLLINEAREYAADLLDSSQTNEILSDSIKDLKKKNSEIEKASEELKKENEALTSENSKLLESINQSNGLIRDTQNKTYESSGEKNKVVSESLELVTKEKNEINEQVTLTQSVNDVHKEINESIDKEIGNARTLRDVYNDIVSLLENQRGLHGPAMEHYANKFAEYSTKGSSKYLGSEEAVVAKMSEHAKELKELMKDSDVSSKDLESKWATQIALIQRYNDIAKYKKDRPMSNDMAAQITGIKPELFQQNKNALLSWVSKLGKLQKEYDNLNKDLSPIAKAEENVLYGLITIQKQLTQGTPVKDKAYEMLSKVFGELKQIYPEADITQYTNLADVINLITRTTKQQTKEIKSNTKAKEENKKVDIPVITTDEGTKTTKEEFVNSMKKASQKKSQEKDLTTNVTLTPRISESFKTEAENLINKLELSADINLNPKLSEKFKADVSQDLNNIPSFDDLNASAAINSENESLRKMSDTLATIIGQIQEKTNAFLAESEVVESSVSKENDLLEKISDKLILIKDFLDKISNINLENEINNDVVSDANNKNAKLKEESNIVNPVISEVIDSLARFNSSLSDIASNLYKVGEVFEDDSIQKKLMRDRKTSRSKENTKNNKAWEDRAKATVLREEQAAAAKAKAEGEAQAKQIAEQVKAQAELDKAEQKSQEKFDKYLENFKTKYRKKEQAQEEKEINDLLSERKKLLKDIFSLTDKVSNLEESGLNAEQTKVILSEKKQEYTKATLKYKSKTGSESPDIVSMLNDRQTSNAFSSKKQQDTATSELEKRYANLVKSFESISKKNYLKKYVNEANKALGKLREDGFDKTSESITKYEEVLNNLNKELNTEDSKSGSLKKVSVMLQGVNKTLQDNSAMDPGLAERFTKLRNELEGYVNAGEIGAKKVAELAVAQAMLNSELERSGKKGKGGFATIAEHLKSINAQFIAQYFSIQDWIRYFRQALTVITEFDTALTEMRKVSNETVASLQRYQKTTFDISTSLGTTALALQQSTADWMRLGESLTEASKSAQAATMLMNVSEFESIDEATTSLVSMSQAYKDLSKMDIIDAVNKVGNEFSISTSGLAEALQSSAAVLSTQGNNFAEAIALVTAGKKLPEYIVIYI